MLSPHVEVVILVGSTYFAGAIIPEVGSWDGYVASSGQRITRKISSRIQDNSATIQGEGY